MKTLTPKKNLLTIVIILLSIINGYCQTQQRDVLTLKNGSVIKGKIIEQNPPTNLKIQTVDGSIFVFKYEEIDKIEKENYEPPQTNSNKTNDTINSKLYGGFVSLGLSTGGGGVLGFPVRFYVTRKFALELSPQLRPEYTQKNVLIYDLNGNILESKQVNKFSMPVVFTAGLHYYFGEKYISYKQRLYHDGLAFNAGITTAFYKENFISLAWTHERFNKSRQHYAYNSQLGFGLYFYDNGSSFSQLDWSTPILPTLFWKFNWAWFFKMK